ncbi:MAG: hypothetical protein H7177_11155 [Rhizobacter sp.]|nr:hypothetical protein [Bacteriovorax sp.]
MKNLKDAMKALFYCVVFTLIALSQVYADICDDAVMEFQNNTSEMLNKHMIAYDNVKFYSENYSKLKSQIAGVECAKNAIEQTNDDRQTIKEKRIETISKFLKLGIKEEGGKDISLEYDYLTGKSKKFKYEFEDVFNNSAGKLPEPSKKYDDIVISPPKKVSVVVNPVSNEKCSDKILENDAVNLQNVRNQDSVGWCYAYAASDLLSFKLKKKISAVSLYNSGQEIENDIRERTSSNGGDIEDSIENYINKKGGLCLEADLPSNDFKFCTNKRYNDFLNNLLTVVREKRLDQELNINQCFGNDLNAAFPGINTNLIKNHINRFGTRKLVEFLYDQQCKKLSFLGIKLNVVTMSASRYQTDVLMKTLDDQITKGEMAGIGYDYNKLNGESGPGGHGSLVVGRRTNPESGACEYLVRNSWGKDCEQKEGDGLSCHKNCDADGCRYSGHFWVSESRLKNSILGVTYLQ